MLVNQVTQYSKSKSKKTLFQVLFKRIIVYYQGQDTM